MKRFLSLLAVTSLSLAIIPVGMARNLNAMPGMQGMYKSKIMNEGMADKGMMKKAMAEKSALQMMKKKGVNMRLTPRATRLNKWQTDANMPKRTVHENTYLMPTSSAASSWTSSWASSAASSAMSATSSH